MRMVREPIRFAGILPSAIMRRIVFVLRESASEACWIVMNEEVGVDIANPFGRIEWCC